MYACICNAVPVSDVHACIDEGAADELDVAVATGAGTNCGGCIERICELVASRRPAAALQPVS